MIRPPATRSLWPLLPTGVKRCLSEVTQHAKTEDGGTLRNSTGHVHQETERVTPLLRCR